MDVNRRWWKEAVVYQIYPKSFMDSNDDGIGDLEGIIERLDYLEYLGVDVVWLNPVYESPMEDNGYDIANYRSIHPDFGTMEVWERLLDGLHDRDIRLIMDLVVNHTSYQHDWFVRSRDGESRYEDYYHWRDGKEPSSGSAGNDEHENVEHPPNNWDSFFTESAWTYDEEREQYYLHLFDPAQPDLNWRNEDVRESVYDVMNWWLEMGIDGFRMDVINLLSKTEGFPNGEEDGGLTGAEHFFNGPRIHEYLSEMHDRVLDGRDVMTVGETPGASVDDARRYTVEDGLDMVFHFQHMNLDHGDDKWDVRDWSLTDLKEVITRWQTELTEGWNSLYLNNHDQPRPVSRFGDPDGFRTESAKLLGTLTHTLRGTPFVYQGEEIGMTNFPFDSIEQMRDVEAVNFVERRLENGDAESFEDVRAAVRHVSRDNARTPMQWTAGENAGFTGGEPWIEVNPNHREINVESARADPDSVLHYYRDLIRLRKDHPVLVYGEYELLLAEHPHVFAYERTLDDERSLVVLHFGADERSIPVSDIGLRADDELLIANYEIESPRSTGELELRPFEARVYRSTQ